MSVPLPRNGATHGAVLGLTAAALFGLSAPLAKMLLGSVSPVLLAGLLYLGAAVGLWLHRWWAPVSDETPLRRQDWPRLGGIVTAGGVLGPVLMLLGLGRVSALTGSLLLNLEAPLTVLLAVAVFREHLGKQVAAAIAFIFAGAVVLQLHQGELAGDWLGAGLLAAACLCWALDNNLTQRLSLRDPFAIVRVKTLVAGTVNVALGLAVTGARVPPGGAVLGALCLGALSYGVSVVLDAYALRYVGAAREAAYFATAPFVGAGASLLFFDEPLGRYGYAALALLATGVFLLLKEQHSHWHSHEPLEHEHVHEHDAHHGHAHGPGDPEGETHSHWHKHDPVAHEHPHVPDAHHRHKHQ